MTANGLVDINDLLDGPVGDELGDKVWFVPCGIGESSFDPGDVTSADRGNAKLSTLPDNGDDTTTEFRMPLPGDVSP